MCSFLPHLHGDIRFLVRRNLHAFATRNILLQNTRVGPLQIPAVFDGHKSVSAWHHKVQRESSVRIGLVPPEQRWVTSQIERREDNHYACCGFVLLEGDARNPAVSL